jgi:hypothetical protein
MVHGTHMSASGSSANMMEDAAVNIQKLYRGYRDRKATSAGTSGHAAVTAAERGVKQGQKGAGLFAPQKQKPKKANEINQPKTMLER